MHNTTTKFRPILFSTPMVQAILEGRKTQTRRTKGLEKVNTDWRPWEFVDFCSNPENENDNRKHAIFKCFTDTWFTVPCPYEMGDVLWVRESFYTFSNWDHWKPRMLKSVNVEVFYTADLKNDYIPKPLHRGKTRPNIFLPAAYARIFLKIKSIRVERLNEISEEDAIAEGIYAKPGEVSERVWYRKYVTESVAKIKGAFTESAIECFKTLWESINGKESLDQNPFVWVYEFERIEKPNDF